MEHIENNLYLVFGRSFMAFSKTFGSKDPSLHLKVIDKYLIFKLYLQLTKYIFVYWIIIIMCSLHKIHKEDALWAACFSPSVQLILFEDYCTEILCGVHDVLYGLKIVLLNILRVVIRKCRTKKFEGYILRCCELVTKVVSIEKGSLIPRSANFKFRKGVLRVLLYGIQFPSLLSYCVENCSLSSWSMFVIYSFPGVCSILVFR